MDKKCAHGFLILFKDSCQRCQDFLAGAEQRNKDICAILDQAIVAADSSEAKKVLSAAAELFRALPLEAPEEKGTKCKCTPPDLENCPCDACRKASK
jgi:hypothetical protein